MTKLRIKELCSELGITQAQLADKLGVTAGAVSQLLREDATPSLKSLERIANILGVHIRELFTDDTANTTVLGIVKLGNETYTIQNEEDIYNLEEYIPNAVRLDYYKYPTEAEAAVVKFLKKSMKASGDTSMMGRIGTGTVFSIYSNLEHLTEEPYKDRHFYVSVNTVNYGQLQFKFSSLENDGDLEYMFEDIKNTVSLNYQDEQYGEKLNLRPFTVNS